VRRAVVAALVVAVGLALAPAARAGAIIDRAVQGLRSDPVYVDPDAEAKLSPSEADRVRQEITAKQAGPMYVAVLPAAATDEAGGSADAVTQAIHQGLQRPGTYAVVVGHHLSAAATDLSGVTSAATNAVAAHKSDGLEAILLDLTDRVGELRAGGGGSGSGGGGGGSGGAGAVVLLGLAAVGAGALLVARRRRRERERAEFAEVKENARDDLVALGDDIRALDLDVEMPGIDPEAREAYGRAVDGYDRANGLWERATEPRDLEPVGAALEEGRYAMTAAKARMEGRPVPERRPPCFFDPRHGPSARDVEWAPAGGTPRPVPACEADAQRVERGEDPEAREVLLGGRRMPYWAAGPMYAPFAGGYFGGFGGGLLPGLLIGEMLGGAVYPGAAWGGDWDDGGGGGDFGGGDFGGGDFGGGDFGGGDF
jgi:uncharacterized membrane protein YgcG